MKSIGQKGEQPVMMLETKVLNTDILTELALVLRRENRNFPSRRLCNFRMKIPSPPSASDSCICPIRGHG